MASKKKENGPNTTKKSDKEAEAKTDSKTEEPNNEQNKKEEETNNQTETEPPPKMPPLKMCICGSGGGAHCLVGLAASQPDVEVRVLTLHEDDAKLWTKEMKNNDLVVVINNRNGTSREVKAKPEIVTKNPEEAVAGSDYIFMAVSPTSHDIYFKAMAPHVGKNTLIVGLPGFPGFEYQCRDIVGEKSIPCTLMNFNYLPWDCKLLEFGKKVEIINFRSYLTGSMIRGRGICRRPPLMTLQMLHGAEPIFRQSKNHLESILMSHSYIRPAIMFGQWNSWDGKPIPEAPLFYETVTKETADLISKCSDECVEVAKAIMEKSATKIDLSEVKPIFEWYQELCSNDVNVCTDMLTALTTSKFDKDVTHEMKKEKGGLVPDFHCASLAEDIPMGTIVIRALADIVEVKTTNINMLIEWCQQKMGKEYIINGELKGKDMKSTRCPQQYGFTTLESIIACQIGSTTLESTIASQIESIS
ncbi:octopine dehydrogenase-like isoform X1 [Mytilus galloprovincialis]|uniref:octopine dehydrogenase-like isoform X1 n=2 Tax=Mytilus galloprovincialis TaxID=29158 RepID=UPI003F7C8929